MFRVEPKNVKRSVTMDTENPLLSGNSDRVDFIEIVQSDFRKTVSRLFAQLRDFNEVTAPRA